MHIDEVRPALLSGVDRLSGEDAKQILRLVVQSIVTTSAGNLQDPFAYMWSSSWDEIERRITQGEGDAVQASELDWRSPADTDEWPRGSIVLERITFDDGNELWSLITYWRPGLTNEVRRGRVEYAIVRVKT